MWTGEIVENGCAMTGLSKKVMGKWVTVRLSKWLMGIQVIVGPSKWDDRLTGNGRTVKMY